MQIIFLIIGIIVGAIIGILIPKQKSTKVFDLEKKTASLETENNLLKSDKERLLADIEKQKKDLNIDFQKNKEDLKQDFQKQKNDFQKEKEELQQELKEEREKVLENAKSLEKSRTIFRAQEDKINEQKIELENLQKKLTTEFENIANRILNTNSQTFAEQNKNNLDIILNPLKERIKEFEAKVENTHKDELKERTSLKTEIAQLIQLNKQVSDDANNLTKALKSDNKAQGNWGEMILEKILERSGLSKERGEYKTQDTLTNVNNEIIRPDAVIYLPDEKHIVVDSKVSLVAYQNYVASDSDEQKTQFLKEHILSIKSHVKGLSEKHYASSEALNTPDFVLLFIPIESSFGIAVQADQEIFSYAWDRKIVIVSPSTLFATLRTIDSIWKQERQTKNALEIAQQSGALYDKFVGFVEDLNAIGNNINKTQTSYETAFKKLKDGNGNLISRVEKIKKLGAKTNKSLPQNLLNEENSEED